MESSFLQILNH